MARDAVPQAQELPQERFLDRAEQRHVRAILAAGQYGAERDQQQFMQIMAGIILPRVNDLGKAGDEFFHGRASTLNPRLESSHASPSNPRLQPPAPYAIALRQGHHERRAVAGGSACPDLEEVSAKRSACAAHRSRSALRLSATSR